VRGSEGKMRHIVAALLSLVLCCQAYAMDKVKAREHYRIASQHYDLGEYKDALDGFKEAYRNYEDPVFLFNIAQCHRQLGNKLDAIRAYRTYLLKVPDATNREAVRDMVAKLDKQLADEAAAKREPPQGTLTPGEAKPVEKTVPQTPVEPPPQVKSDEPPPAPIPAPAETVEKPKETPVYKKWWLWTIVGGVVALGVGVGVGVALTTPGPTPMEETNFGTVHF
jgi:hypothetical protein